MVVFSAPRQIWANFVGGSQNLSLGPCQTSHCHDQLRFSKITFIPFRQKFARGSGLGLRVFHTQYQYPFSQKFALFRTLLLLYSPPNIIELRLACKKIFLKPTAMDMQGFCKSQFIEHQLLSLFMRVLPGPSVARSRISATPC